MSGGITYRRMPYLPAQPLSSAWIGFKPRDDGNGFVIAAHIFGREAMKEVLRRHGREALRYLFKRMKAGIAERITELEQSGASFQPTTPFVDVPTTPSLMISAEEMRAILGPT